MTNFFTLNSRTGLVELDTPDLLLIKEFKELMANDRNKCSQDKTGEKHLRAFKEFTYIYLAIAWNSPYCNDLAMIKHENALSDSGLSEKEFNDETFRAACRKYEQLQNSNKAIQILNSTKKTIDNMTTYFDTLDLFERKEDGSFVVNIKDVQTALTNIPKVLETLKYVEEAVKKEREEQSQYRGGAEEGFLPDLKDLE